MAKIRPYADASLNMVEELKDMIARIHQGGELRMAVVVNVGYLDDGSYSALVEWAGLDEEPS